MHPAEPKTNRRAVRAVRFDRERLRIEDIADIARGVASAELSDEPEFRTLGFMSSD